MSEAGWPHGDNASSLCLKISSGTFKALVPATVVSTRPPLVLPRFSQPICFIVEATSSSATLQGRDFAQSCPPLDDKIESALDQQRLNNFRYPASDSQVSIARSIQTVPRSPTQEFYSAPATPVPAYDEPSSQSSSPTTLPVADEEKCKDKVVVECHNSGAPPPASVDQPFGRIRALCQPYMW